MTNGASTKKASWTIDDVFEHRYTVIALLLVLIACLSIILWLLFSMSRYEREGDQLASKMKYSEAYEKYVKALQRQTFSGKDRLLFKIGQTLAAMDEIPRAGDYLYQLMKDYPGDNYYHRKAKALAANLLRNWDMEDEDGSLRGASTLIKARDSFRRRYRRLLSCLVKGMHIESNRSRTKKRYEQYKAAYENYQKILSREYREAVKEREQEKQERLERFREETGS